MTKRILFALSIAMCFSAAICAQPLALLHRTDLSGWTALSCPIASDGSISFNSIPAGTYELLLSSDQAYFAAKAKAPDQIALSNFSLAASSEKTINTSHSGIRQGSIAGRSGGDTAAAMSSINTTRSNIKHPARSYIKHDPYRIANVNAGGKTVYYIVLEDNIVVASTSSAQGTIANAAASNTN